MPNRFVPLFLFAAALSTQAQQPDMVIGPLISVDRVILTGDLPAALSAAVDRGPRAADAPVTGVLLLRRPAESERAFDQLVSDLSTPASPRFHEWVTATQIGSSFGPSSSDIARISAWLAEEGFAITGASPDGMTIAFSGTVRQADATFRVAVHDLVMGGEAHYSATTPPSIPAALAPVIAHVIAFNDLNPKRKPIKSQPQGVTSSGGTTTTYLAPADLATIYNYNPLFRLGITGKGVAIALLEDADQNSLKDWQTFRKVFGLSRTYPYGSLSEIHPQGSYPCIDPGQSSTDGVEQAIDVDAATMSAPNATLVSAACKSTNGLSGDIVALANLLQSSNPPSIASNSFGDDEPDGAANGVNALKNMVFEEAAARGISVFNSSGDTGASFDKVSVTSYGLRNNGSATSPYVTAVGGTDSAVVALRENPSTYFSPTNRADYGTALSYIPEIPWNATCASSIRASLNGYPTDGPGSFCNSLGADNNPALDASGGGPSACATGVPSTPGVVSGTCKGYPKPTWQTLVGVPDDGVRDTPDVAMFSSNNVFGYSFRVCDSATASCLNDPSTWEHGGGTSLAAPVWAGIQALVNQATGKAWGLANPQLYSLADASYGVRGNPSCNSSLGNKINPFCMFHDITLGDSTIACIGSINCYNPGGQYGVLSVSSASLEPAYPAQNGYDFSTGIGTPDVTNLVIGWVVKFRFASGISSVTNTR